MLENKGFRLNKELGYFKNQGVDVMAFDDIYPSGHQSGVSILMHGKRVATNGDIRFEQTPGQWQPIPKQGERVLSEEENSIVTELSYPDLNNHLKGFNPMIYPDLELSYRVSVQGRQEDLVVTVDLDRPVPAEFAGKLCFNMELFPGELFGKPWIMDGKQGVFPRQPNGPTMSQKANYDHSGKFPMPEGGVSREFLAGNNKGYNPIVADDLIAEPYAVGQRFTCRPDDAYSRFTIESEGAPLKLYDGRMNHNNGWFVLSSEIPEGKTEGAVQLDHQAQCRSRLAQRAGGAGLSGRLSSRAAQGRHRGAGPQRSRPRTGRAGKDHRKRRGARADAERRGMGSVPPL